MPEPLPSSPPDFARPTSLPEALRLLDQGGWRMLAGGTDLYPGAGAMLQGAVLDVTGIDGLAGITLDGDLRIGAATSWTTIASASLHPALHALQAAARVVGGRQVQVAGTIGGNLCNASPAADTLLRHARGLLSAHKVPDLLEFRDQIPRSAAGKVLRGKLMED